MRAAEIRKVIMQYRPKKEVRRGEMARFYRLIYNAIRLVSGPLFHSQSTTRTDLIP